MPAQSPKVTSARVAIRQHWSDPVGLKDALLAAVTLSTDGPVESIALQGEIRMARERLRALVRQSPA